jgi:putative ABC transport system permease protein
MLTILGIVVGVVSVVSIVSIGEGVKRQIGAQINHVGKDLITVRPGKQESSTGVLKSITTNPTATGTFSTKEVEIISKTKDVGLSAPVGIVSGRVSGGDHDPGDVAIIATTENLVKALKESIEFGGNFDDDTKLATTAIIGSRVADRMFDEVVPLGRSINIRGEEFHVAGVLDHVATSPFSSDIDFNDAVYIPYDSAQRLTDNSASTYEILVRPSSPDKTEAVIRNITKGLASHRGGQADFSVLTHAQTAQVTNDILNLMTALIGGVAAISLIVGGIGIMNIMLVSVTERMHEIGIRKAVGATNRQILDQFMMESTVLSLTGGIIGIIISYLIAITLRLTTTLQPVITWQVVAAALFVSLAVGILFGSAPALKAAKKDPISALRNE